jgi:hypothetical protein
MKVVTRSLLLAIAASFSFGCAEQPGKKKDDDKKDDKKGDDKKGAAKADDKAEVDPPKKE